MHTTVDKDGRSHCGDCGQLLQEIGDVLPVHTCPPTDFEFKVLSHLSMFQGKTVEIIATEMTNGKDPHKAFHQGLILKVLRSLVEKGYAWKPRPDMFCRGR